MDSKNIDFKDKYNNTLLYNAVKYQRINFINMLLQLGAD